MDDLGVPISRDEIVRRVTEVLDSARKEILISSGELPACCWQQEKVLASVKAAMERGVNILVVVGPTVDTHTSIVDLLQERICVAPRKPRANFVVADGKNARIESTAARNVKRFGDRVAGGYLRSKFYEALRTCQPLKSSTCKGSQTVANSSQ